MSLFPTGIAGIVGIAHTNFFSRLNCTFSPLIAGIVGIADINLCKSINFQPVFIVMKILKLTVNFEQRFLHTKCGYFIGKLL